MALFKGGLPYAPDVRRLKEAFPEPEEGELIPREAIEAVLGLDWDSGRCRNIVEAWKKDMLKTENIHIGAVPGFGVKRLSATERMQEGKKYIKSGIKKADRGFIFIVVTPRKELSGKALEEYDHALIATAKMNGYHRHLKRDLCLSLPSKPEALPRPSPELFQSNELSEEATAA